MTYADYQKIKCNEEKTEYIQTRRRIDPDELEPIAKDEPEDPMPDIAGFLDLPLPLAADLTNSLETNQPGHFWVWIHTQQIQVTHVLCLFTWL